MIIRVIFAILFGITLLVKIVLNLKFKKKKATYEECSINAKFNDKEIPLSEALKNFKH